MVDGEQTNQSNDTGNQNPVIPAENKGNAAPDDKNLSPLAKAEKVRDELEAENDRREKILQEEQKLKADELISGTTGGRVEPKKVEISDEDYAKKALSGELNAKK